MEENLLTPEQVAEKMNVKPRTVKGWLRAGRLQGCKVGRLWRVPPSAIPDFIQKSTEAGAENQNAEIPFVVGDSDEKEE